MVQRVDLSGIPDSPPPVITLTQQIFNRGVISLIDESKLPRNALKTADNHTLAEDGAPQIRPGIGWYGEAPSVNEIEGAAMYVSATDEIHLIIVAGGTVYRSIDDGETWTACTGATLTTGHKVRFELVADALYIFNGWDNIVRYGGSTVLSTYTALGTPTGNVPTKTGLAANTYTYGYRVSAVNDVGYTIASPRQTIQVSTQRDGFNDTNYVTFTWAAVTGAVRYDIYVGQVAGEESYIDSLEGEATTTYIDKGQAVEQVSVIAPDANTTQGPRVGDLTLVGSRLYGTADRDYPNRIWISGAGRYIGMFSSAYDATYLDWQKGGKLRPVKTEDYRDGKGTPLATVWCKSIDGQGAVLQGTLESMTVDDVTFPIPNFYKLPGSRGTNAPDSVVNVLNDYMYYNSQAFYNLGSRAQFLNLLSTDESSANIRPDMKRITPSASDKVVGFYSDAKVYFSVPRDGTENNTTIIFDTERKAWLPKGFTVGFDGFFTYTDQYGDHHLLCWKPGDTKLSHISEDLKGDYGQPFAAVLETGLMPVNPKNRFEFIWCEEGEFELAEQAGQVHIELSGITREDGYRKITERDLAPTTTRVSWSTFDWATRPWSDTSVETTSFSEPSLKRFFNVQEEINAYQYRLDANSLNAFYILRTLQINGTGTQAGKPSEWELLEA